jgi:hypothetical protein
MKLFEKEGFKVHPTAEALLVPEVKALCLHYGEKECLLYLAYIEFMHSFLDTNPYAGYDDDVKEATIIKDLFTSRGVKFERSDILRAAEGKYVEFRDDASPTLRYYLSSLKAAENLRKTLEHIDLSERTKGGSPVYKPQDISRALKDTNEVVENLYKLRKKVQEEDFENKQKKGGKKINIFEQ